MRNQNLYLFAIFSLLFLNSCINDVFNETPHEGITFSTFNKDKDFTNIKISVGGMKNDEFIATESIIIPKLEFGSFTYFRDDNRWKPNLDLIRNIPSDSCYFWIKLTEERNELLTYYENYMYSGGVRFSVSEEKKYISGEDGYLIININKEKIRSRIDSEND